MKTILATLALSVLAIVSTQAQGYVAFNNTTATKISTNKVENGVSGGFTGNGPVYYFALYYSTTATSVNGQTTAIAGRTNLNYAFNDANWTLAAYGTNLFGGIFSSANADSSGRTPVSGVPGGTSANFVVIGWSAGIGTTVSSLQTWFNAGSPSNDGWIGQSLVSGSIVASNSTATPLFATNVAGLIRGFMLGRVVGGGGGGNVAPSISAQPTDQFVTNGQTATFSVGYGGNPTPTFQWFCNGTNIPGQTASSLVFSNATTNLSGNIYFVTLTNIAGSVTSSNAALRVAPSPGNVAPYITVQPANKTVTNGQSASFSVSYGGTPTPTLQWFCNGTNIPGQTSSTFTVSNATTDLSGNTYFVTLTNIAGSVVSSNAVLTVNTGGPPANVAPYITVQPANRAVTNGLSATFSVGFGGTPSPTFQWFCNGTNIPGKTSSSLSLSNVTTDLSGNIYFVTLTNVAGSVTSSNAVLTVLAGPSNSAPSITIQPTDKSAVYGASVSFVVGYSGYPTPTFQWFCNGTNIPGKTSSVLTLNNITANSVGTYFVTLTNSSGSVTSSNAMLTVTNPPAIIIFANNAASVSKTFTNSTVGGAATGLTSATNFAYYYALYVSTNATAVNGQTAAILGADSTNYAFGDANWSFVAYATNNGPGRLTSMSADALGRTAVNYASGQATARFVVLGWSAGIGTDVTSLATWFNGGNPTSDGWIGQSGVSGAVSLGSILFATNAPYLQGFTLGLVAGSVNGHITYSPPPAPPLMVQAALSGQNIQLTWPLSAGSYGVQSSSSPTGPWNDAGLIITSDDVNASATAPVSGDQQYFRLIQQ